MRKLFYSWQSDLKGQKTFLNEVLDEVAKRVGDLEIETATRKAQGAVDITSAIYEKIEASEIIVADVSVVNTKRTTDERPMPNPNVLYELGYAIGKKSDKGIILLANAETTKITQNSSDLPFDIRNRLVVHKKFTKENKEKLIEELVAIIGDFQFIDTAQLEKPYISLETTGWSPDGMSFRASNDEPNRYQLDAIQIASEEIVTSRMLEPSSKTENIYASNMPIPPYELPYSEMSFVVTRLNESFRIYQRMQMDNRADGKYNLIGLIPNPIKIVRIPKRRLAPSIGEVFSAGDSYEVQATDSENSKEFGVRLSGTLAGMLSTQIVELEPVFKRLAQAITDYKKGEVEGTYIFRSDDGVSVNDLVGKIESGKLLGD